MEEMKKQGEALNNADPNTTRRIREQPTLMRVVDREVRGLIMVADSEMKRYHWEHPRSVRLPRGISVDKF